MWFHCTPSGRRELSKRWLCRFCSWIVYFVSKWNVEKRRLLLDFHKIGRRFDCFLLPGIEAEFREQYLSWYWKSTLINRDYLHNRMNAVYILCVKNHINCTEERSRKDGEFTTAPEQRLPGTMPQEGRCPCLFQAAKKFEQLNRMLKCEAMLC